MDVALLLFLIALNGLFAMSEMALTASRKARLQVMIEAQESGAQAAMDLHDNPTKFLSVVQIGITSIGVLNGIVGDAAFSAPFAAFRNIGRDRDRCPLHLFSNSEISTILKRFVNRDRQQARAFPHLEILKRPVSKDVIVSLESSSQPLWPSSDSSTEMIEPYFPYWKFMVAGGR